MFEYKTKQFAVANGIDWVSDWLNSLYKGGFGVKVVGYVCTAEDTIVVTILRWKLKDKKEQDTSVSILNQMDHRKTIDEIPEEPTIAYPDSELPDDSEEL